MIRWRIRHTAADRCSGELNRGGEPDGPEENGSREASAAALAAVRWAILCAPLVRSSSLTWWSCGIATISVLRSGSAWESRRKRYSLR